MHRLLRLFTLFVAFAAVPLGAAAQERTFTLGEPLVRFSEPFSFTAGVAELADGRILVVDRIERRLSVLSADGKSSSALGGQGEGPLEYGFPSGVTRGPGDSLFVFDGGNRRYLVLSPAGRIVREITIPSLFLMRGGLALALGVDSLGRIYWQGDIIDQLPTGVKRRQLQNVRRWTPAEERIDTVASPADHAPEMHDRQFHPFAERDAVVIARDGRVGVVSAREYRLRWFVNRSLRTEGPSLSHDPVEVTAASRVAFRRLRASSPAGAARVVGPPGAAPSPAAVRQMEEAFPDAVFPPFKPPFVERGARLTPAEDVWVVRSGSDGTTNVRIDVLANTGARRGHLLLPPGRHLVALERSGVYLARTDEDGLQWIERYAWPAGLH